MHETVDAEHWTKYTTGTQSISLDNGDDFAVSQLLTAGFILLCFVDQYAVLPHQ